MKKATLVTAVVPGHVDPTRYMLVKARYRQFFHMTCVDDMELVRQTLKRALRADRSYARVFVTLAYGEVLSFAVFDGRPNRWLAILAAAKAGNQSPADQLSKRMKPAGYDGIAQRIADVANQGRQWEDGQLVWKDTREEALRLAFVDQKQLIVQLRTDWIDYRVRLLQSQGQTVNRSAVSVAVARPDVLYQRLLQVWQEVGTTISPQPY